MQGYTEIDHDLRLDYLDSLDQQEDGTHELYEVGDFETDPPPVITVLQEDDAEYGLEVGDVLVYDGINPTSGGVRIFRPADPADLLDEAAETYDPGDLLRRARKAADITQEEMADRLGVDQRNYSRRETGDVRPGETWREKFRRLADELRE